MIAVLTPDCTFNAFADNAKAFSLLILPLQSFNQRNAA